MCLVTYCTDPCTGDVSCQQDYLLKWEEEWQQYDCKWGVKTFERNCTMECSYDDCSATNNGNPCWIENCDDGCNNGNCTVWYQDSGEWFGAECEAKEAGLLDNVNPTKALGDVFRFGRKYEETIGSGFDIICPEGDEQCDMNGDALAQLFQGK